MTHAGPEQWPVRLSFSLPAASLKTPGTASQHSEQFLLHPLRRRYSAPRVRNQDLVGFDHNVRWMLCHDDFLSVNKSALA
jgi:hypothetical protein